METKLAYSQHLIYPIIIDINNQWEQFIAHFTQLIYEGAIYVSEDFKLFMDLHGLDFYGKYITITNQTNCLMN
jgi:hypothetical protein